jgi:hypothetical protein
VTQTTYREGIQQVANHFGLVQKATALLEEVLSQSTEVVTAEWDQGTDALGRPVIILRLSDFAGSVTGTFEPSELDSFKHARSRLRDLYDDLLQIRTGKLLARLLDKDKDGEGR